MQLELKPELELKGWQSGHRLFLANLVVSFIRFKGSWPQFIRQFHCASLHQSGWQETTLITLEGNKYEEFIGLRVFWEYEKMEGAQSVSYTFKDGCFGFKVMTDYNFGVIDFQ